MSSRLLRAALNVSSMTLLSRIMGFVRDILLARMFGAGVGADAFFIAFKIPNFMRRLFAEGSFSQAFVPVLSEYKTNHTAAETQLLIDRVAGTFTLVLAAVTCIGILAAPWLIYLVAPGFSDQPDKQALTIDMLRLTFPYLLFISLTAFAGGILNTYHRFAIPAFTPVLLNLSLIGCALWLAPRMDEPVLALAWGVLLAGISQLLLQWPALRAIQRLPRPRLKPRRHAGVQKIKKLMLPTLIGSSVAQVNLLFDTLLASFLVTGSISWLYYSDRLVELPLGIFGIAIATVILPNLSRQHIGDSPDDFNRTMDWALRLVLMLALPATTALMVLATPLLATLFHYGAFSEHDVSMASHSLMAYALGLFGFMSVKVLVTGFYARQDTRTPVRIAITAMLVNMVLNILLMPWLAHAGLALATTLSSLLNAGLLYFTLRRHGAYQPGSGWLLYSAKLLLACLIMAASLSWLADSGDWMHGSAWNRALHVLGLVCVGLLVYFSMLYLLGLKVHRIIRAH